MWSRAGTTTGARARCLGGCSAAHCSKTAGRWGQLQHVLGLHAHAAPLRQLPSSSSLPARRRSLLSIDGGGRRPSHAGPPLPIPPCDQYQYRVGLRTRNAPIQACATAASFSSAPSPLPSDNDDDDTDDDDEGNNDAASSPPSDTPPLTPQQIHNAKVLRDQQAKAARTAQRIHKHEARVTADGIASEAKRGADRVVRRRQSAARAVPYLLALNSDVFERTLRELNLSLSSSAASASSDGAAAAADAADDAADDDDAGPSPDEGGEARGQYRAMYMDSIPSFADMLVENPSSVAVTATRSTRSAVTSTTAQPPEETAAAALPTSDTERLLDELADVGFADSKFTRQYRQRKRMKERYGQYVRRVRAKVRNLEERKMKLVEFQKELEGVEREMYEVERRASEEIAAANEAKERRRRRNTNLDEGGGGAVDGESESQQASASPTTTAHPMISSPMQLVKEGISKLLGFHQQEVEAAVAPPPKKEEEEAVAASTKSYHEEGTDTSTDAAAAADSDNDEDVSLSQADKNTRRKLRRLRKRVAKHRRTVRQAEDAVDSTTRQIDRLRAEREKYRPTLSDAEYDEAGTVAGRVLADLCPALAAHMNARHAQMIEQYRILDAQTDLTKPHEWYPRARLDRRRIIFHGGPTNSGKTYNALQQLKEAGKGLYLGPLRLLAAEIYENLTSEGVYTNLFTGQEKRIVPFATHSAATVEMCPLDQDYDVVVIDEIQMISDPDRGFAWTRALLGVRCSEIHVCGGMEARPLVEKIANYCGDDFELNTYERFSALEVADRSLADEPNERGSYSSVQAGDCVVAFSRNDIFAIKREIERTTGHKCCVIYGSLPPQTRSDQARRFNDPNSGYDVLVASDAIGMGLNLSIKRIIFNSMFKSTKETIVMLDHSAVKQISGRAGRRNSPFPVGEVTCRDPADMDHLKKCMSTEILPVRKAGLLPTSNHFELFAAATQKYNMGGDFHNLHRVLRQFEDMARIKGDFFLCRLTQMRKIAKHLDDLPLLMTDKYNFCMAPVNDSSPRSMALLKNFAQKYAFGETNGLHQRKMLPKMAQSFEDLSKLCSTHHELELFLWLCFKFPGGTMMEQQVANALKEETITAINEGLGRAGKLGLDHCYIKRDRNLRASFGKSMDDPFSDDFHDFVESLDEFDDVLPQFEVEEI